MDKTCFGKTGLMVSRIGIGGIPLQRPSIPEAVEIVRGAIGLGINFIDTANGYSDSEERIGFAIKGIPRGDIVIATKSHAKDKKTMLEHIDLSLRRLGTDYIDLYQHHDVSTENTYSAVMGEGGAFEGLMEAVRAGKVRFPGFSSHSIPLAMRIMREGKFDSVQLPLNYVDDEAAKEAVPLAQELNMGFIAMKPFGGGLLDDAKLSIRYLSQFRGIVPDPGIQKLSEIEEIVRIFESGEKLSAEDEAAIAKKKAEMGDRWCHRCGYCQPCPQEISINKVLTIECSIKRFPLTRVKNSHTRNMNAARTCLNCRECVGRCPYNLDIPQLIKEKLVIWDRFLAENE